MQNLLFEGARQFNLSLTEVQLDQFNRYLQELLAWNQQFNLTGITEPDEVVVKHFLDSLSVYPALSELSPDFSLIDVGSGAGFPGVPLKIVLPKMRLTLLESVGKKARFLQHLVETLSLAQTVVVTARAEEVGRQAAHREWYDVAVARALAPLPILSEYLLPLVKVGGTVIAQKGQYPDDELKKAGHGLKLLGGRVKQTVPVDVPGLDAARHLVVIEKLRPTPSQYPRQPGLPAKKPL